MCTAFAHFAVARHNNGFSGYHHIRGALDAVSQTLAATVEIVELRLRDAIVDIESREEEFATLHHLVEAMYARCCFLAHALHVFGDIAKELWALFEYAANNKLEFGFVLALAWRVEHGDILFSLYAEVNHECSVATIVHNQARCMSVVEI